MQPDDGRVVSNFIVQALANDDITIYGDGTQTRAFCFVTDMVEGLLRLMNFSEEKPAPVNLGNPIEVEIGDLAEQIIHLVNSKSKIVFRPLPPDDPTQRCPDITRAKTALGWAPQIPLEDGLKETITYFQRLLAE